MTADEGRTRVLGWWGIVRLGLVQAALGSVVVLVISTLNRVMVVEYSLPALLPGALVALHYAVQLMRPTVGHGSDRDGRRTPWIVGGMLLLSAGGFACACATVLLVQHPVIGLALAVTAYAAVGVGAGAAGTTLLVLLATRVRAEHRAAAASIMWIMMIAGFAVSSAVVGRFLDPFSAEHLLNVAGIAVTFAFVIACLALHGTESTCTPAASRAPEPRSDFRDALRRVWADLPARRFTWFVFISMLAYSAQELLLEPFAGLVFGYSVGGSAQLSGLWHGSALIGMVCVGLACSARARIGSLRGWMIAGCLASAGALLSLSIASFSPHWPLRISVIGLGLANGAFAVAAIGSMMELAHQGENGGAGIRMGLWGASQAVAFALGGLCGNFLIDFVRHWAGSPVPAYAAVFACEATLFCAAAGIAMRLHADRHTGPMAGQGVRA